MTKSPLFPSFRFDVQLDKFFYLLAIVVLSGLDHAVVQNFA
ncbi:hypothetical protein N9118_06905 [Akkermansiaceae bacterium]|nr:hypothetical protein [bacterium]MDB4519264.1 hypothetical protein [Akkermansiaceae bacterium]